MLKMNWCHYLIFYITAVVCITVCSGVYIKQLVVPPIVELGCPEVVLDCEYKFENKNSNGLVVKWFFNNKSNPVYQWIHKQPPQDVGPFKGKLDLGYKASQDPLHAHRALKILNVTSNMTGNYICVVSTFDDEDFRNNTMLVFTPGKNFNFRYQKNDDDTVKIICSVEDVYPQPSITVTSASGVIKDLETDVGVGADGLFDIIGSVVIKDSEFAEPEEFVCQMHVSQANYYERKSITYIPGVMPTAQLTAAVDNALEVHEPGNGATSILNDKLGLYMCFMVCLWLGIVLER